MSRDMRQDEVTRSPYNQRHEVERQRLQTHSPLRGGVRRKMFELQKETIEQIKVIKTKRALTP